MLFFLRSGSTVPYVVERLCQEPHCRGNGDRWYVIVVLALQVILIHTDDE